MQKENKEIWKEIKGYEGLFAASSLGRIKALAKPTLSKYANTVCYRKERIFKQKPNHRQGYILVNMSVNKKITTFLSHRLIAETFLPKIEGKNYVNHKNGIKHDNRVCNLEWVTKSENSKHSFQIGLQCNKGEQHPQRKLTNEQVIQIRNKYKPNGEYSTMRLAKEFNISNTNVKDIINKKIWSHI